MQYLIALQEVLRAISHSIAQNSHEAVLICGDLTSRGNADEYADCVRYLLEVLNLNPHDESRLHVVPGNHDVDRLLCTSHEQLNPEKFIPIANAWSATFSDVLVTSGIRRTEISRSECELQILSLNSCIGCGEWRLMPRYIVDQFVAIIKSLREDASESAFQVEGEQLDTPMFRHDDIGELNNIISSLGINSVPVVLSHHNLLPQEFQRVEIYTELINSGQFRTALTSQNRPIVYCHGHIHRDPIECIKDGTKRDSQLICVSAPELITGFNELRFYYSQQHQPIGMEVVFHRLRDNGIVVEQNRHRIPFTNGKGFMTQELDDLKSCLHDDRIRFFALKALYEKVRESEISNVEFADTVTEAEWLGLLEIEESDKEAQFWVIRRRWL